MPTSSEHCPETPTQSFSRDRVFELLSNRRRRLVLYYLRNEEDEATVRELASEIAAWENGVEEAAVTYKQRKRVYTSLYQSHLPKMDEYGVVEYEQNRGEVRLTEEGETLDAYLEVVSGNDLPWSDYFLGLSLLSFAFLIAVTVELPPFAPLSPSVAGLLVGAAFGLSALVHMVRTHRSRVLS
ncbi:hypothetical protein G9C84_01620 [Halolamina sp. R1-12]|nr:hypothetical protein [Halolamina sp. R1-12]